MKLFCNCNSIHSEHDEYDFPEYTRRNTACFLGNHEVPSCRKCGYFPWVDADYENMMYDLKGMNT